MDDYQIISGHQHGLYRVPEHEVLLSFNNDSDALAFIDWLAEREADLEDFVDNWEEF